jgi:hypothetical protein
LREACALSGDNNLVLGCPLFLRGGDLRILRNGWRARQDEHDSGCCLQCGAMAFHGIPSL